MRRIVIVGASAAGLATARTLREEGFDGEIVLVGKESHRPYDRTVLSKGLLHSEADDSVPELTTAAAFADLAVDWCPGTRVRALDVEARRLDIGDRRRARFDGLVIATGAEPVRLDVLLDVRTHVVRTYEDAIALRAALADAERVVVIGAGFVGCEVASMTREGGRRVTLLDAAATPLDRALPAPVGRAYADLHRARGVDLRCATTVRRAEPCVRGASLELSDGELLSADVVVEAVGVRPAVGWLAGCAGIAIGDGILCDSRCRTGVPGIVAAGDAAAVWHDGFRRHVRVEHWLHAEQHGAAAARSLLAGDAAEPFVPEPIVWSEQFGHRLDVIGWPGATDELALLDGRRVDVAEGFVAASVRERRVTGLIAVDRPRAARRLRGRLRVGMAVHELHDLMRAAA